MTGHLSVPGFRSVYFVLLLFFSLLCCRHDVGSLHGYTQKPKIELLMYLPNIFFFYYIVFLKIFYYISI